MDSAQCDSHPANAALAGKALTLKTEPLLLSTHPTSIPRAAGHSGLPAPQNEETVQGHLVQEVCQPLSDIQELLLICLEERAKISVCFVAVFFSLYR